MGTLPAPLPPPNSRVGSAAAIGVEARADEQRLRNRKAWLAHGSTPAVVLPGAKSASVRSLARSQSVANDLSGGTPGGLPPPPTAEDRGVKRLDGGGGGADGAVVTRGEPGLKTSASVGVLSPGRPVGSLRGGGVPSSPAGHLYSVPSPSIGLGHFMSAAPGNDHSEVVDINVPSRAAMAAEGLLLMTSAGGGGGGSLNGPASLRKGAGSRGGVRTSPGSMRTAGVGSRPPPSPGGRGPTIGHGGGRSYEAALLDISTSRGGAAAMAVLAEHQAKYARTRSMGSNSTPAGYLLAGTIGNGPGRLSKNY